jgi:hypothetical protein
MPLQSLSNLSAPASTEVARQAVTGAWADARAAAEFAATISVNCTAEGHGTEPCLIRDVAEDGARRSLAVARELAGADLVAA